MGEPRTVDEVLAQIHELLRAGQTEPAEAWCRQLLAHAPHTAAAWFYLGRIALQRLELAAAEVALRQAVTLDGQQAIYFGDLSVAVCEQGRPQEAESWAQRAIALDPWSATYRLSLGNAIYRQERWQDAASAYRECVSRDATLASAWNNLGSAEHRLGHLAAAAAAYERSLAFAPEQWDTLRSYAAILNRQGQPQHAEPLLRRVLAQVPTNATAWLDLGNTLNLLGRAADAETAYRQSLALAPGDRDARFALAGVLALLWRLPEAEAVARDLLNEDLQSPEAWGTLGWVLHSCGRADEALAACERSSSLRPQPLIDGTVLLTSQYVEPVSAARLLVMHRRWDVNYGRPLFPARPPRGTSAADRPLRLGFVSADFGRHPIGFLTASVFEHIDRAHGTVVCYSDRLQADEVTARVRAAADEWRHTAGVLDEDLAEQIRQDQIDILFDLAGHTANRLLLFARKPAAMQVTWLGYVGTTGLSAMDCLLADRFHVLEGEEIHFVEQVLRMPNGYGCYAPPADSPAVSDLPARAQGQFTFGCFNNVRKYGPALFDTWAAILRRTPAARLLLKYGGLDQASLQADIHRQFADRGIDAGRITLEGWSHHGELLAAYSRVDLALDTQPYSGGLTTCEALWMGVPVIAYPGQTFAGRHSTSYLSNAGCDQFVAADRDAYVELAVSWAQRLAELATIRAGLRAQLQQSPVCDAPRFARDLLSLLRQTWAARVR